MTDIMIIFIQGSWRILTAQGYRGRFDYRVDAEEAALRLVVGRADARIRIQSRFGELEPLAA